MEQKPEQNVKPKVIAKAKNDKEHSIDKTALKGATGRKVITKNPVTNAEPVRNNPIKKEVAQTTPDEVAEKPTSSKTTSDKKSPKLPAQPKHSKAKEVKDEFEYMISKQAPTQGQFLAMGNSARLANLLVMGIKSCGKSDTVLPLLAKQDICNSSIGATFIVSKKDMAYTLYAMAKKEKRKITILKPSTDLKLANEILEANEYNYDLVAKFIDYKQAIKDKHIVIIDMEHTRYKQNAIRATAMLLIQMQIDMQDTKTTLKRRHSLHVDDAQLFLPFLETILIYGDDYNLSTTLYLQSRSQLKTKLNDYTSLIDNNVRNTILMNGITYEDAEYYSKRLSNVIQRDGKPFIKNTEVAEILSRPEGQIIYEILGDRNRRIVGTCPLCRNKDSYTDEINKIAIKERKRMAKVVNELLRELSLREEEELEKLRKKKKNTNDTTLMSDILKTADKAKEKSEANIKELINSIETKEVVQPKIVEQPKVVEPVKVEEPVKAEMTELDNQLNEEMALAMDLGMDTESPIESSINTIEDLLDTEFDDLEAIDGIAELTDLSVDMDGADTFGDELSDLVIEDEVKEVVAEVVHENHTDVDTSTSILNEMLGLGGTSEIADMDLGLDIDIDENEIDPFGLSITEENVEEIEEPQFSMYDTDSFENQFETDDSYSPLSQIADTPVLSFEEDEDDEDGIIEIDGSLNINGYKERIIEKRGYSPTRIILPKASLDNKVKAIHKEYFSKMMPDS